MARRTPHGAQHWHAPRNDIQKHARLGPQGIGIRTHAHTYMYTVTYTKRRVHPHARGTTHTTHITCGGKGRIRIGPAGTHAPSSHRTTPARDAAEPRPATPTHTPPCTSHTTHRPRMPLFIYTPGYRSKGSRPAEKPMRRGPAARPRGDALRRGPAGRPHGKGPAERPRGEAPRRGPAERPCGEALHRGPCG